MEGKRGKKKKIRRKTGQVYFMLQMAVVELDYVRQSVLIFARPFPWLIFLGILFVHWLNITTFVIALQYGVLVRYLCCTEYG